MSAARRVAKAVASWLTLDHFLWVVMIVFLVQRRFPEAVWLLVLLAWRGLSRDLQKLRRNRPDIHISLDPSTKTARVEDRTR